MQVKLIFDSDSQVVKVVMPDGQEKRFDKVSTALNWCKENGYEPVEAMYK